MESPFQQQRRGPKRRMSGAYKSAQTASDTHRKEGRHTQQAEAVKEPARVQSLAGAGARPAANGKNPADTQKHMPAATSL